MRHHCTSPEEAIRLLEKLFHISKEHHIMAEVELVIAFTVSNAPPPPLQVTPQSVPESLVVGQPIPSTVIAVVSGGTAPYTYAIDPSSQPLPAGLSITEDGNGNISLSGTPTATGTANFILDITDALGAQSQAKIAPKST